MNKNDSAIISHLLTSAGMEEVNVIEQADVVIVNTCSVRSHAEQRAFGYIATLRSWREQRGSALAIVGCMAQRCASTLMSQYPFIDLILGPDSYRGIVQHLDDVRVRQTRIRETSFSDELYSGLYPRANGISDFVSIMRGCSNYCSYCVVPFVRGPARSRPASDIMAQVSRLIESGVKDITLLGQNVNEYFFAGVSFAHLLEDVARRPGLCRLRFLTSHPKDLSSDVVDTVQKSHALCEWFHLPLQSGNDRILNLMNRRYTREDYLQLVRQIRSVIPCATITTDLIAGFPTESEDEFQDTIEIMKEISFDDAYLYRYSPRSGTRAAELEPLAESLVLDRLHELIDVQHRIMREKCFAMIGRRYEVLFESKARNGGTRGKTRGNKDIVVRHDVAPGTLRMVVIKDVKGRTPIGDVIESRDTEGIDNSH